MERSSQERGLTPARDDRAGRTAPAFARRIDCGAEPRRMAAAPAESLDGARVNDARRAPEEGA